ncbi:MAG: winged helix-turn-helix domain-containing protein [Methanofollis sp.]|nr:winged helix-turn-helix domain-containing protein [Methanofollis sp.]
MKILSYFRNRMKSKIISLLITEPGLSRKEIAVRLGTSTPAASRPLTSATTGPWNQEKMDAQLGTVLMHRPGPFSKKS